MSRLRFFFLLGLGTSWALALVLRLFQLQIVEHEHYRESAESQQSRVMTLTPPRGTIYDRGGRELAVSIEARSAAADPGQIDDPSATAGRLAAVLDVDVDELTERLASDRSFVWIERKLDRPVAEAVEELDLAGVFFVSESKRYYPLRQLAAHVLGYVGVDHIGLAGLESLYDKLIQAEDGERKVIRDARFGTVLQPRRSADATDGRPGRDLHLTLDATLQYIVESELDRAVESSGATKGMAVMMDPQTGAILAMASWPTYDPNHFGDVPGSFWRNQVVMDAFEPGSTFKMATVAAALEAGAVEPDRVFHCENGGITLGRTRINDHKSFGVLTVSQIIAKSSNVGAIKIGHSAGPERLYETYNAFGFGRPTGIDLPSENPGILRPLKNWSRLAPAYYSFGQGVSVTALQLANAFAAIANGGRLLEPYVVAEVGRPGEVPETVGRRRVLGLPVSPSSVREVRDMLVAVVADGTAKTAQIPGYTVAGKTGTAQKAAGGGGYLRNRYIASFVGFAPAEDPAIVLAVVLDEPWPRYHGGEVAAPAFQAMAEKSLLYLGVRPDREPPRLWPGEPDDGRPRIRLAAHLEPEDRLPAVRAASPRPQPTPDGTVPDFAGQTVRQAAVNSQRLGLKLHVEGHGKVVRQKPAPGTPFEAAGREVTLWLGREES